jgi:hypothetical protein
VLALKIWISSILIPVKVEGSIEKKI